VNDAGERNHGAQEDDGLEADRTEHPFDDLEFDLRNRGFHVRFRC
jgi:hypothetical protein